MNAEIGDRLSFKGDLCSVRYVGRIPEWPGVDCVGVEWDDPSRGKNNGVLNGVVYFECRVPGAGSFLKCSKNPDRRLLFSEAVYEKYSHQDLTSEEIRLGRSKVVETLGVDKISRYQSQVSKLPTISVSRMGVAFGNTMELGLTRLDLGFNLLDMAAVVSICGGLQNLSSLVLNGNRFEQMPKGLRIPQVKDLSMASTLIRNEQLPSMFEIFPSLERLNLASNNLDSINIPPGVLKGLDLSDNKFKSVPEIEGLEELQLEHNQIETLPRLRINAVNLNNNRINDWSLDNIDVLDLRISGNPVGIKDLDPLVIGRLPRLQKLNGTLISQQERTDSELYLVSKVKSGTVEKPQNWLQLCAKHSIDPEISHITTNLKSKILNLQIEHQGIVKPLKVVKTISESNLRVRACKLFQVPPFDASLLHEGSIIDTDSPTATQQLQNNDTIRIVL